MIIRSFIFFNWPIALSIVLGGAGVLRSVQFRAMDHSVVAASSLWSSFKSGDVRSKQTCDDKKAPLRIILPFKDQRSANSVRRQLGELSRKSGKDIHPVYTTRKIGPNIRPKESKPRLLTNNALFTILSVICSMRIMSATHADTCINALKNIRDLPSGNTSEINMGGTQDLTEVPEQI